MPLFEYIVRNEEGKRLEGTIEAKTLNEANENLLKKKYTIVKLSEKEVVFDFLGPFLDRLSLEVEKMKNKIPLTTLVFFTRQLSTMFSAGLTLEKSIFFLSQEEKHKKFKKILGNMDKNIKRGMLLSDTLERNPGVFSNLFIFSNEIFNNFFRQVIDKFFIFYRYFNFIINNILSIDPDIF